MWHSQGLGQRKSIPVQQNLDLFQGETEELERDDLLQARQTGRPVETVARGSPRRRQQAESIIMMERLDRDAGQFGELCTWYSMLNRLPRFEILAPDPGSESSTI